MNNEEMNLNEEERFSMIPVVPLRGLVVLPNTAMSLDVGRKQSIADQLSGVLSAAI